jgi:hypothetical protein
LPTWIEKPSLALATRWVTNATSNAASARLACFGGKHYIGGIKEPQGSYAYDIFGNSHQVNNIPPKKLIYLKAFLMQVAGWVDIEHFGELPEPVECHLHATRILKPGDSRQGIIDLLARNRDEWLRMAAEGREQGYKWAWLLAPPQSSVESGALHASQ